MFIQLWKHNKPELTVECPALACNQWGLIYLELKGATEATRAIWAHLVKYRSERNLTNTNCKIIDPEGKFTDRTWVGVIPRTRYHMRQANNRLFMFHYALDRLHREYLLGGDETNPSPFFRVLLQQKVDIPFLPHWLNHIWEIAQDKKLVTLMPSFGVNCFQVKTNYDWSGVLRTLFINGGKQWPGLKQ